MDKSDKSAQNPLQISMSEGQAGFRRPSIFESAPVLPPPLQSPKSCDTVSLTASDNNDIRDHEKPNVIYDALPNGGYGWVVVVCCFMLEFFAEGPVSAFGVFQDYYVNERFKGRTSNATISLIGVLSSSCMAILGVVSGKLCERFGYKIVPLYGVFTLSLGYFLASFAYEPWHLLLTQGVLCGVGAALTFLPAVVVPAQWFDRHRGLATGAVSLGIGVGGIVWTEFDHLLIKKISVSWVLRLTSVIVLAVCTASLMLIKTYRVSPTVSRVGLESVRNSNLFIFLTAAFFTGISSLVPFYYLPAYAKDIGISSSGGALITSIANAASLAGRVLGAVSSDYFGPLVVLVCAYALTSSSILFIWATTHSFGGTMAFGIVFGLGYGATFTQTSTFVAKYFGVDTLPVFVGLYYTLSGIGYLFGPPIAGVILEKTRSWGMPYIALKLYAGVPMYFEIQIMKIAVALVGMLSCAMAWVWPLPTVFETGSNITAAPLPTIVSGYTTSALLSDAIKRYNDLISVEAFTPPADYNRVMPTTSDVLSTLQVKVASNDETLSLETDESYTLDVPVNGEAILSANTVYGAIRGLESYSQLFMNYEGTRVVRNTPVHIEDRPVLAHRGIMLDTARNYYPVKDIKRTLDAMSYNKLNVLHWHIVDSQSWPVESKTYPDLQKNGAYGTDMQYSYADVKDIIQYAKGRGIRIIPEFDMPGHMFIVGETYPDIMSCMNKHPNWDQYAAEPPSGQLNIADPAAAEFAVGVISEYAKLFTDEVFNLGGDEVNRKCWEEDSKVKEYISKNANATVETLLADFYTQVHTAVKKQKKVGMSWEETLFHSEYTPPKDTIIQTWIDEQSIPKTVAKGYRSIASPSASYYLDCGHGSWLTNYDGNSWCDPFKSWMHIYNFDPFANVTDSEQRKLIIGAEVALWSEQSDTVTLDKYLWPRAAAMAETAWTGKTDADGHVRTTAEVTQRMHDQRFRMVGRGIGAEPLQPLWCVRNPGKCLLP
ncbi:Glucosamine-6-phosphate isomerase (Glucosamine-6-phosphate deaminase) (GNPDA) (GlcN6P deaminase) [Coemansia sp. RSA 988]|nr:Glucosamine-6-phosphate isomerase (Glucosamine-6-phosphate deaminase) (GNPDA) (GlcN6P deaminase) [Coemansia sp. RSA 988]